ncbi:molybdopterin oxidoreductase family protein [Candidatus Thioglobus autotrophicus]|uniref:molybdopterin oxidoreductase family protein n=1 Tax=Candidatus Thioglobus autotrophicus TaxID=1705394 RepID=UPI00299EE808|nr:molybdopterin-dependent oxidoreductase [Candidatus Thioglobus autotrophicus]WPE16997.1 molybdopterin-dependent oxidoreductase [Candidatus Thioglobus autotrophicus]WPE18552.1 molybdopterin-dependent oxidoreductase [Candidatus Thioglobus autotrophicus]
MSFKTTCPYCGVGCGIEISRTGSSLKLIGDKDSPVNQGMLCIKGQTLLETVGSDDDRLLVPSTGSWSSAIKRISEAFKNTPKDSIALYLSGQMLMEDLYVAKKFTHAYGIKNLESNSRLCMYSTVAANNRAYGSDIVPVSYDDIYHAETVFIIGSNTADCHPIVFNHIKKSKAFVVCVDVYKSTTAKRSDLFIQVEPGQDMVLIDDLVNQPWFKDKKTLSVYSQGLTQSTDATDKVNALINAHIKTGNINKPGCGVLSLTGQCNAMGGREIGIKTQDLTATEFFSTDQIKTLWVMATNPAHSMINYRQFETLIVSDFTKTLTTQDADIVLPACSWSEQTGHQKNSERRYLEQNAFLPPAGESKPDWEIICLVAKELGLEGFDYAHADEIWTQMDIDQTWTSNIQVREVPVEINTPEREYGSSINNGRLLAQWHGMSRTGKSETLNKMTQENSAMVSIHHITNTELFKDKEVELDKYSKQPCFKG